MQEQLLAVQRMQDYINQHLSETITLADFSKYIMLFAMALPQAV